MPRYKIYEYVAFMIAILSLFDSSWSTYRIIMVSISLIVFAAAALEYLVYFRESTRRVYDYLDNRYDLKVILEEKKKEKRH